MPIIALFSAHIEIAFSRTMVKVSHGLLRGSIQFNVEWDMLIEGIRLHGVVSHSISRCHIHILLGLIDFPALFSKAIEIIIRFNLAGV